MNLNRKAGDASDSNERSETYAAHDSHIRTDGRSQPQQWERLS